jgi:uncharacterized protein (DUF58 family)
MAGLLFSESFLYKLERLALLSRRATAGQTQGERRSTKRGHSVEFSDFRPYVPGDDFRRIDWNAYARLERFFIKLFVEEEDLTVHLLIDTSRSMDWGEPNKLGYAVQAAASLGYVALVGLDRVTVTALGDKPVQLPAVRGKSSALSLFDFLQNLPVASPSKNGRGPASWLGAYAANARRPGPVLLFSDLMDDGWQPGLNLLAGRGYDVSILHILSPDEANPDLSGDFRLLDSETDHSVEITADFETLERYRLGLDAWRGELRRFCNARGMHYMPVESSLPLEELLFAGLRRQGILK